MLRPETSGLAMTEEKKMAETLGSLVDKLTIKDLRDFYIKKLLSGKKTKAFSRKELKNKLKILRSQKRHLNREIEDFILKAVKDKVIMTDEKLKLYNKSEPTSKIKNLKHVSSSINGLAKKNIELWHLEDEARRRDVNDAYIGRIKKKIDKANQQRNDLIDVIDRLFKSYIKKYSALSTK